MSNEKGLKARSGSNKYLVWSWSSVDNTPPAIGRGVKTEVWSNDQNKPTKKPKIGPLVAKIELQSTENAFESNLGPRTVLCKCEKKIQGLQCIGEKSEVALPPPPQWQQISLMGDKKVVGFRQRSNEYVSWIWKDPLKIQGRTAHTKKIQLSPSGQKWNCRVPNMDWHLGFGPRHIWC